MPRFITVMLIAIASAGPVDAATVAPGDGEPCDLVLSGDIAAGDAARLVAAGFHERTFEPPTLCLDSRGGSFSAAIDLMYAVDGFGGTAILPGARCQSACALVFMAGRARDFAGYCEPSRDARSGSTLRFPTATEFRTIDAADRARLGAIAASRCYTDIARPGEGRAPCACAEAPIVATPLIRRSLLSALAEGAEERLHGDGPDPFEVRDIWQAAYLRIFSHDAIRPKPLSSGLQMVVDNVCNNLLLAVTERDIPLRQPPPEVETFLAGDRPLARKGAAQLARLTVKPWYVLSTAFDGRDAYECWTVGSWLCIESTSPHFPSGPACVSNTWDSAQSPLYQLHPLVSFRR